MVRVFANRFEIVFWEGITAILEKSQFVRSAVCWIYAYSQKKDFLWIPALLLVWLVALVFTGVVVGNAILH
jgi:hypothetical protein